MQETRVQSLDQEDLLEKRMVTHSSILVWRIPWSLAGHSLWGCQELDTTERLTHTRVLEGFPGGSSVESCSARDTVPSLGWEDPPEKGMVTHSSILAWRIPWTVEPGGLHGVTKSQTQLSEQHTLMYVYT